MGLSKILVLDGENRDAVAVLSDALKRLAPDLVLTGTVAESGGCSGLVPYMLSASLGWPVIANVTAFDAASEALRVTQAVAGGHRRQYEGRCPAVLSVAAGAASPRMSALAARRRGSIEVLATAVSPIELPAIDTRPARKRGARIRPGKSSPKSTGVPIVDLDAKAAAQLIIEDLRAHGFMGAPQTDKTESKLHV
jgi:electron transfer flavoprotein beta subunit